jgi:sensor domain CHASE-containing protein
MYIAIDRTSKFTFCQLVDKANRQTASAFLVALIAVVPYKIHTVLTDKRFHYDDHEQLRRHLNDFINAYNYGRRLKL